MKPDLFDVEFAVVLEFLDSIKSETLGEAESIPAIVTAWAEKAGMKVPEALRRYKKAGEIVSEQYPKVAKESDQWYRLKVGIFKGMMGFKPAAAKPATTGAGAPAVGARPDSRDAAKKPDAKKKKGDDKNKGRVRVSVSVDGQRSESVGDLFVTEAKKAVTPQTVTLPSGVTLGSANPLGSVPVLHKGRELGIVHRSGSGWTGMSGPKELRRSVEGVVFGANAQLRAALAIVRDEMPGLLSDDQRKQIRSQITNIVWHPPVEKRSNESKHMNETVFQILDLLHQTSAPIEPAQIQEALGLPKLAHVMAVLPRMVVEGVLVYEKGRGYGVPPGIDREALIVRAGRVAEQIGDKLSRLGEASELGMHVVHEPNLEGDAKWRTYFGKSRTGIGDRNTREFDDLDALKDALKSLGLKLGGKTRRGFEIIDEAKKAKAAGFNEKAVLALAQEDQFLQFSLGRGMSAEQLYQTEIEGNSANMRKYRAVLRKLGETENDKKEMADLYKRLQAMSLMALHGMARRFGIERMSKIDDQIDMIMGEKFGPDWDEELHGGPERFTESKAVPDINSPVYREKVRKSGRMVDPLYLGKDGGKLLAQRLPGWTKADHLAAAAEHEAKGKAIKGEWSGVADAAAQETWGRKFQATDYRISGIGSDEFSDEFKEKLRKIAHTWPAHLDAALAHRAAARMRSLPKDVAEAQGFKTMRTDGAEWRVVFDPDENVVDVSRDNGEEEIVYTVKLIGSGLKVVDENGARVATKKLPQIVQDAVYDMLGDDADESIAEARMLDSSTEWGSKAEVQSNVGPLDDKGIPYVIFSERVNGGLVWRLRTTSQGLRLIGESIEEARSWNLGDDVKIGPGVKDAGKTGTIAQVAPSGKFFGVKDKKGKFLGYYHESDLLSSDGDDDGDADDESLLPDTLDGYERVVTEGGVSTAVLPVLFDDLSEIASGVLEDANGVTWSTPFDGRWYPQIEEARKKKGYWRTTRRGHRIYIENGKITKGNPFVMKGRASESVQRYDNLADFDAAARRLPRTNIDPNSLAGRLHIGTFGDVNEMSRVQFKVALACSREDRQSELMDEAAESYGAVAFGPRDGCLDVTFDQVQSAREFFKAHADIAKYLERVESLSLDEADQKFAVVAPNTDFAKAFETAVSAQSSVKIVSKEAYGHGETRYVVKGTQRAVDRLCRTSGAELDDVLEAKDDASQPVYAVWGPNPDDGVVDELLGVFYDRDSALALKKDADADIHRQFPLVKARVTVLKGRSTKRTGIMRIARATLGIIHDLGESLDEAGLSKGTVLVYDKDRKTVLAEVSKNATSIGAAKAAKVKSCEYARVDGKMAWVVKESVEESEFDRDDLAYVDPNDKRVRRAERDILKKLKQDGPTAHRDLSFELGHDLRVVNVATEKLLKTRKVERTKVPDPFNLKGGPDTHFSGYKLSESVEDGIGSNQQDGEIVVGSHVKLTSEMMDSWGSDATGVITATKTIVRDGKDITLYAMHDMQGGRSWWERMDLVLVAAPEGYRDDRLPPDFYDHGEEPPAYGEVAESYRDQFGREFEDPELHDFYERWKSPEYEIPYEAWVERHFQKIGEGYVITQPLEQAAEVDVMAVIRALSKDGQLEERELDHEVEAVEVMRINTRKKSPDGDGAVPYSASDYQTFVVYSDGTVVREGYRNNRTVRSIVDQVGEDDVAELVASLRQFTSDYVGSLVGHSVDVTAVLESVDESEKTARELGIQDPNSSGQGSHPDHANNPYHKTLTEFGYTYSHSTPVGHSNGKFVLHHTYKKGTHDVTVFRGASGRDMFDASVGGSGRYHAGSNVPALEKYLKGRAKRIKEGLDLDPLHEFDPITTIAALGSVVVGGAIGAGLVKAIRTIKELISVGKESQAEKVYDKLSKDEKLTIAQLTRKRARLAQEALEEGTYDFDASVPVADAARLMQVVRAYADSHFVGSAGPGKKGQFVVNGQLSDVKGRKGNFIEGVKNLGGTIRVAGKQVNEASTPPFPEAERYVRSIKNVEKQQYARAYLAYLLGNASHPSRPSGLAVRVVQDVHRTFEEMGLEAPVDETTTSAGVGGFRSGGGEREDDAQFAHGGAGGGPPLNPKPLQKSDRPVHKGREGSIRSVQGTSKVESVHFPAALLKRFAEVGRTLGLPESTVLEPDGDGYRVELDADSAKAVREALDLQAV